MVKTLSIDKLIQPDALGTRIAQTWHTWNGLRASKIKDWEEVRKYVYATDTTTTTNSKLPWKNKTTIPKICQIRDNLHANYMMALFPKRRWVVWEGDDKASEDKAKKESIEDYMMWAVNRSDFKNTVSKLIYDWIDNGNCFPTSEWADRRVTVETEGREQVGYVGPVARRISPYDIVMNPTAPSFEESPFITKALVTLGDIKDYLSKISTDDNQETNEALFNYLRGIRNQVAGFSGELQTKDEFYRVDGFNSYQAYLSSDYCEVLTFHGDLYDVDDDTFYKNYEITIVDRHKVINKRPNPSVIGRPNVHHSGWRLRQDNLWAQGPLENLIGMQYRIDHVENLKADVFDLITFPPLKIKGYAEDFEWGPMSRIYVGDDGDVEMIVPDFNVLNANLEISNLEAQMEEMAGAPKEAMGIRSPGEKTKYEVQRLENASGRIFQNKLLQFSEQVIEPLLIDMLELARRKNTETEIRVFDDEFKIATFKQITPQDLSGNGRIRPIAASHFAEQAETLQNVSAFFASPLGQLPQVMQHFSGIGLSKLAEDLLNIDGYKLVMPFIQLSEQADAQRLMNAQQEQVQMEAQQPTGIGDDVVGPTI